MGWPEDGRAAVAARGACASQRHFATSDFWGSGLYYDEYYDATLARTGIATCGHTPIAQMKERAGKGPYQHISLPVEADAPYKRPSMTFCPRHK